MSSLSSNDSISQWMSYRSDRSSSSSDSGVAVLSPPMCTSLLGHSMCSVLALSPPGLSPLTIHDSAFSTPTPSSSSHTQNRFTFDHVPFRRTSDSAVSTDVSAPTSAFDLPPRKKKCSQEKELVEVLKGVRRETQSHDILQRTTSIIPLTVTQTTCSLKDTLTVHVETENPIEKLMNSQLLLMCPSSSGHNLLSSSLSSPLASPAYLTVSPTGKSPLSLSSEQISTSTDTEDPSKLQYYCAICKKDFRRPDILSRHLRRHTGEKPFGCDACGRFFSRSDHLRTHRRTHTDEKPYPCSICSYAARRRDVLTRHMATRHQAKAGASSFQRHRDVRRCLSDGDKSVWIAKGIAQRNRDRQVSDSFARVKEDTVELEDDVIVDDIEEEKDKPSKSSDDAIQSPGLLGNSEPRKSDSSSDTIS
ncbi:hypothetical protein WR25_13667 [Diploscapter pachys]|uniref:C2H2-type domain-containing protein n=1 Tax=Diploscapter pachys TaxID=2018661 RepID=A0A2A2KRW4_9BILA|nr:hypothetical protein WR25_13667 [Diploscapter pachys]